MNGEPEERDVEVVVRWTLLDVDAGPDNVDGEVRGVWDDPWETRWFSFRFRIDCSDQTGPIFDLEITDVHSPSATGEIPDRLGEEITDAILVRAPYWMAEAGRLRQDEADRVRTEENDQ
jgi:hypothetical protein